MRGLAEGRLFMGSDEVFMGAAYERWNIWKYYTRFYGINLLARCLPTTHWTILWVQVDEIIARISNPAEKQTWMQQELNPWLQGDRQAPKPLKHEDLLGLRALFFHLTERKRSKQTFPMRARILSELGTTKLLFSFKNGQRNVLSLWLSDSQKR